MLSCCLNWKKLISISVSACVFCAMLFIPDQAHAGYLDLGSGSTVVQWIIAGIAVFGRLKRRILTFFPAFRKVEP